MTKKEFVREAIRRGYCTKHEAEEYAKISDRFTERDLRSVFEIAEAKRNAEIHSGFQSCQNGRTTKHFLNDTGNR